MSTLLLLDFDGVLQPFWSPAPFNDFPGDTTARRNLEAALVERHGP